MSLGQWVSVSGAAFTTGAGARTGLGFSALLGLLGVRLGYWWRAGDTTARAPHMLTALWHEITGAFNPDTSSHWYLSDGGHFENTAAYELIRRRVKRIVLADCGADPHYEFEDLANLALKVRIDFGAELQFFGPDDLDRYLANEPATRARCSPTRGPWPAAKGRLCCWPPCATPTMHSRAGWWWSKPRLPSQLSADLARYAERNPAFPQQPTADQFYDEAQWESHHRLGPARRATNWRRRWASCRPGATAARPGRWRCKARAGSDATPRQPRRRPARRQAARRACSSSMPRW